jgi:malate synthase
MPYNNNNQPFSAGHFWKLYMFEFVDALKSVIDNKQFFVVLHVLRNLNSVNQYIGTIQETAQRTGVSYKTVQNTFNAMCRNDLMRMKNPGVYMFNPDLLMKGPVITKLRLTAGYNGLEKTRPSQVRKI